MNGLGTRQPPRPSCSRIRPGRSWTIRAVPFAIPPKARQFDISVQGAHTNPQRSLQAPGVRFTLVRVEDATDGDQRVDPAMGYGWCFVFRTMPVGRLRRVRWPRSPSSWLGRPSTTGSRTTMVTDSSPRAAPSGESHAEVSAMNAQGPDADGNFRQTFTGVTIPRDATGTFAVGIEGYRCVKIVGLTERTGGRNCTTGNTAFDEIRDVGPNVVTYFGVTDTTPVPRRMVVDEATKCVACHGVFSKDFRCTGGAETRSSTVCCATRRRMIAWGGNRPRQRIPRR